MCRYNRHTGFMNGCCCGFLSLVFVCIHNEILFVYMISSWDRTNQYSYRLPRGCGTYCVVQLCGGWFSSQSLANKAKSNFRWPHIYAMQYFSNWLYFVICSSISHILASQNRIYRNILGKSGQIICDRETKTNHFSDFQSCTCRKRRKSASAHCHRFVTLMMSLFVFLPLLLLLRQLISSLAMPRAL